MILLCLAFLQCRKSTTQRPKASRMSAAGCPKAPPFKRIIQGMGIRILDYVSFFPRHISRKPESERDRIRLLISQYFCLQVTHFCPKNSGLCRPIGFRFPESTAVRMPENEAVRREEPKEGCVFRSGHPVIIRQTHPLFKA